jgi:hypothetical protein
VLPVPGDSHEGVMRPVAARRVGRLTQGIRGIWEIRSIIGPGALEDLECRLDVLWRLRCPALNALVKERPGSGALCPDLFDLEGLSIFAHRAGYRHDEAGILPEFCRYFCVTLILDLEHSVFAHHQNKK